MTSRWTAASDYDFYDEPWKATDEEYPCRQCGGAVVLSRDDRTIGPLVCDACYRRTLRREMAKIVAQQQKKEIA